MHKARRFYLALVLLVITALALGACGDSVTSVPASTSALTTSSTASTTVAGTTSTSAVSSSKIGQELLGQVYTNNKIANKVLTVDAVTELKHQQTGTVVQATRGVFLVVKFEINNGSSITVMEPNACLVDSQGKVYFRDALKPYSAMYSQDRYKYEQQLAAGSTGLMFALYDVPASSTGLMLATVDGKTNLTSGGTGGSAASTTAAVSTTARATTSAATTGAATTVAATKAPSTTAPAAKPSAPATSPTAPNLAALDEIEFDEATVTEFSQQTTKSGLSDASVEMYVSNDELDDVAKLVDMGLTDDGYKYSLPGSTAPVKSTDGNVTGLYSKTGEDDVLVGIQVLPADAAEIAKKLDVPGLKADSLKKLTDQLMGHKVLVTAIIGKDIFNSLSKASQTPVAVAPSAAPATTQAPAVSGGKKTESKDNGVVVTLNSVEHANAIPGLSKQPDAGNEYIMVDVTVTNEQDGPIKVSIVNGLLVESANPKIYTIEIIGRKPEFPSSKELAKGEKVRGWFAFQVPKNLTDLSYKFTLRDRDSKPVVSVELPLS